MDVGLIWADTEPAKSASAAEAALTSMFDGILIVLAIALRQQDGIVLDMVRLMIDVVMKRY